jgi:hypothetical protein
MKLRLFTLTALSLAASASFAGTKVISVTQVAPNPPINVTIVDPAAADTVVTRLSGATALRFVVAQQVLGACGGAGSVNGGVATVTYNFTPPGTISNNLWGITCRLATALNGVAAGTDIAFFKTDQGGSAQGVFPVALPTTPLNAPGTARPFLGLNLPTGCTAPAAPSFPAITGCAAGPDAKPNFGISDLEPAAFKAPNVPTLPQDPDAALYPSTGLTEDELATLTVTPVVQTVFGIAVNTLLYNEMFAKQGLGTRTNPRTGALCSTADFGDDVCVPSMGYAEARTYFGGAAPDWRLSVRATDPLTRSPVNICRRANGSGTQAASNVHLLQIGCNTGGTLPALADYTFSNPPVPFVNVQATAAQLTTYLTTHITNNTAQPVGTPSNTFVFEGPSNGDVVNCLNRANTVGGYAVGHVSRENQPGSNNWRHVKTEGALPLRDNLKAGGYDYAFESTVQWVTTGFAALSANQQNFIQGITNALKSPAALQATLSAAAAQGVAALPDSYAGDFGTGTAAEIAFGSRVTRGGNSCSPFTAVK